MRNTGHRHPEVLAAQRQASKDGSECKRRSFETPRKRAAPQDDGDTCSNA
jgi:hypothetical protein